MLPANVDSKTVYTTFYPTTAFAEAIAGDLLEIVCPLPHDADPIFWQPSAKDILDYQNAALIITNGAGFERWLSTASLPPSRLIDTAAGFEKAFLHIEGLRSHSHGGQGEHSHEGLDGHTWLDPVLAGVQARAILEAFVVRWPEQTEIFQTRHEVLENQFEQLDRAFAALAPRMDSMQILCSHPAYQYLAKRYGWRITNFDLDPDTPLSVETLNELKSAAAPTTSTPNGKCLILWESQPLLATQKELTRSGIPSVWFSPVEMRSQDDITKQRDYFELMRANLARLEAALDH
ncbi:MAG: zinc ABC transporter solute-binding protein [Planctomycetes bacterium]|nr:zinc ABC transporter solute-binding protein [Planctomycetota bacterium]MBT4029440.1 zinc ABC transporter solute-binding protein [Planctomycetota bacterium]MBT4559983.1 zinc ABC transporter solute-binding protein [Planctomycetota bacterium]MBT7013295.1 zinc ABC transporter solute-binding protein [Planctomycetota bacterium]MBT7317754.1 zinc ABC transporter solute-binding protein [Planctomycetota bacterium]